MSTALILLALVIPLSFLIIYYLKYNTLNLSFRNEGFIVQKCPVGKTSYITDDGNTNCCSGEVINNFCSNIFCSLSPSPSGSIPNCTKVLQTQVEERSAEKCPVSIAGDCNNYFTNTLGTIQGCSKSSLNADRSGPSDLSQPYCRLYPTPEENTNNYDSCNNYLERFNSSTLRTTCNQNLQRTTADLNNAQIGSRTLLLDLNSARNTAAAAASAATQTIQDLQNTNIRLTADKGILEGRLNAETIANRGVSDTVTSLTRQLNEKNNELTTASGRIITLAGQIVQKDRALDTAAASRNSECSRFNEAKYLELNPDVKAVVDRKELSSGKFHYSNQGIYENRPVC